MTRKQQVYHVAHLVHVSRNEKCLLNSVSERIKLVYRINLLGTAFKKKAAFQTSKTTIYRPHTSELKSISKYQLLTFHLKIFEKLFFYTLLEAGETELINYEIRALYRSR